MRDGERHTQGAERWRGSQPAQARRADVQDSLRIDGQQGGSTAQQYREHIERDGGQDDLGAAQELQTLSQRLQRGGLKPGSRLPDLSQEEEQAHEYQDAPGIDRIRMRGPSQYDD